MTMKIFVCVKHVPDTAAIITVVDGHKFDDSVRFIMNPYDEMAMAEAAHLKGLHPGSEVVVISLGKESAMNSIRLALAMGADRGIFIKTDSRPDSQLTALALKTAIAADGLPDLILTGRHAIDSEGMQTSFRLAHLLGMPVVTNVNSLQIINDRARLARDMEAGSRELIDVDLPCLIGAGKGLIEPMSPKLPEVIKARQKKVKEMTLESLSLTPPAGHIEIQKMSTSQENRQPKIMRGTPLELAGQLVAALRRQTSVLESFLTTNQVVNHG